MGGAEDLGSLVRFGGFELDRDAGELRKHGLKIRLADQPFQILLLLLERPGRVVTREELKKKLWESDTFVDFDRGLNKAVNRLRDVLGDSADRPRFIETLPKRGYRFIASVENSPLVAGSTEADPSTSVHSEASPAIVPAATTRFRWGIWASVVTLLMSGGAAAWLFTRSTNPRSERHTLVVAELENLTGDPAFDVTLKQGLMINLEQSPFLKVVSEQEAAQTLRLMGRTPDQKLTLPIAKELCLRSGGKAILSGSVARLGNEYVLGLRAINCQTGETLGQEQVRSRAKEEVLGGLDKAAANLRVKLGESLSSIRRFDRPLTDFVSTSSLEAFQAYVNGQRILQQKGRPYAVPFFRRATDLDSNFALAYIQLAILYDYLGELREAAENTSKAYELRERVSEPERLMISAQYFLKVTDQPEKVLSICQLWSQGYPTDGAVHERTSWAYMEMGQHEKALAESLEAQRKRGNLPITEVQLARVLLFLNHFKDARKLLDRASAQNPDQLFWHEGIYFLGFLDGDTKRMEEQVDWAMHTPGAEDSLLSMAADTNAFFGRLEKAREVSRLAVEFAQRHEFRERAAMLMAAGALREAWLDNAESARLQARAAVNLVPGKGVRALAALALARAGDAATAGKLADQLAAEFPSSALIQYYWLPAIRAQVELRNGHYSQTIELLQAAAPYDLADTPAPMTPVYIRAEALLGARLGNAAATEFQRILDHRGIVGNSPLGALARLGSARAYALSGDVAKAGSQYREFLSLWKEADAVVPAFKQANAELLKLK